jgi:hypothetical protein
MKTLLRSGEIKFYFNFFPALLSICRSRKARETSNKKDLALPEHNYLHTEIAAR